MNETIYDPPVVNDYGDEPKVEDETPYQIQQWKERMKHNPTNYRRNERIKQSMIDKQKHKLKLANKKKGTI